MIRKMVTLYKSKRLLWDSELPEYYNRNRREDVWREISLSMNVPVKELKKKMTSLLGSYRREKSREKKSLLRRSGKGNVYKSKWFAFTWFAFLSNKKVPNDTIDTMDNADTQEGPEETRQELTTEEPIIAEPVPTTSHQYESPASQSTPSMPTSQLSQTRKRRRRNDATGASNEMLLEAYSILKRKSAAPTDNYETFGNYIVSELRKYDSHTLPYVKKGILDVLFRADLGEFTPTHDFRKNAGHSNPTFDAPISSHDSYTPTLTPTPPPASSSLIKSANDLKALEQDESSLHDVNVDLMVIKTEEMQ